MIRASELWDPEDDATLWRLCNAERRSAETAARQMHRSLGSVHERLKILRSRYGVARMAPPAARPVILPDMLPRPHVSLSAELLGDPPPGRSALDRKQARAST